jgi:hypothetical protein
MGKLIPVRSIVNRDLHSVQFKSMEQQFSYEDLDIGSKARAYLLANEEDIPDKTVNSSSQ